MAGHFQQVLVASDLSSSLLSFDLFGSEVFTTFRILARFVPFAIFVCVASMLIFMILCV